MRFIVLLLGLLTAFGCSHTSTSERDKTLAQIDSLETVLFADSDEPADREAGMLLVRAYAKFYQEHKTDTTAIDMLFKAGEVSMGIGQGNLAVKYFSTIAEQHEDFMKSPEALFLAGFCEENLNQDSTEARAFYESFIDQFPDHKLAEDAKFSIQNMSMSDEELIDMFEKNLKTES